MTRFCQAALLCAVLSPLFGGGRTASPPTFAKDIAPLLEKHCQVCHRPGEIGPMSLLTYEQARPWAKAIKSAVLTRAMPPWDADPHYGKFANNRSLSEDDIQTLVAWADSGAAAGDLSKAPKPIQFADGWQIGTPDIIFEMPKAFHVPASGVVDYQCIKMPTGFTKDTWVEAVEVRPSNRAVVHHAVVYTREPDLDFGKAEPYNEFFVKPVGGPVDGARERKGRTMFSTDAEPEHLQVYAPGADPIAFEPGKRVSSKQVRT